MYHVTSAYTRYGGAEPSFEKTRNTTQPDYYESTETYSLALYHMSDIGRSSAAEIQHCTRVLILRTEPA